ncbi:MAG: fluoride efflux transporter CrcB [Pseudomonadota bacterium]
MAYVALGGALGSVLRAMVGASVGFPMGTLMVNVVGSFLIGIAFAVGVADRTYGPFLMIGLFGGFTTFSTFSLDTLKLVQSGQMGPALAYIAGSVALSLVAVWAGYVLGGRWA